MKKYNYHPEDVGSITEYFVGDNLVSIQTGEDDFFLFNPAVAGDYFTTDERHMGFENTYFMLKWFTSVDPDIVATTALTGDGVAIFSATPDPSQLGEQRYRSVCSGCFLVKFTDHPERPLPTASGPIRKAKLTITDVPPEATHFIAYAVRY